MRIESEKQGGVVWLSVLLSEFAYIVLFLLFSWLVGSLEAILAFVVMVAAVLAYEVLSARKARGRGEDVHLSSWAGWHLASVIAISVAFVLFLIIGTLDIDISFTAD